VESFFDQIYFLEWGILKVLIILKIKEIDSVKEEVLKLQFIVICGTSSRNIRDGWLDVLWRACNDLLPTKENLYKRWRAQDPICPMMWRCTSVDVRVECNRMIQKCSSQEKLMVRIDEKDSKLGVTTIARRI
jgi:hypothetical protein